MISVLLSRLVLLTFGILYPAYASYKTIKTKNVRHYVKWMMYWIVFAVYTCVEIFTDIFLSFWFPFYYELKIAFVIWLICPATRGSTYLFKRVINPQLSRHEVALDSYIDSLWDHGYDIARTVGAQGLDYLGHLILELLRKGQITAAGFFPTIAEVAQPDSVIDAPQKMPPGGNISDDHNLDEEDFDILMAENPELYRGAKLAASRKHSDTDQLSEDDSATDEDFSQISVKSRPLKLAAKTKGRGMALRERRKKIVK